MRMNAARTRRQLRTVANASRSAREAKRYVRFAGRDSTGKVNSKADTYGSLGETRQAQVNTSQLAHTDEPVPTLNT